MRYCFDDFEVDGDRLQLKLRGAPIKAEPRVLELVLHLLAHRDRLVSKEELVETIWQGRAISDAALSSCLYQARRLLGDSSAEPRYLKTVHGRGLRFAEGIEVRELAPGELEPESAAGGPDSTSPRASGPLRAAEPAAASAPADSGTGPERRLRVRRRGAWLFAGLALIAAAIVALGLREGSRPAAPPDAAGRAERGAPAPALAGPILAVLPLSIEAPIAEEGADDELELLALSIVDLLRSRLAAVPGLEVRPLAVAERAATSARSLREAAERAGATHLVAGSLAANEVGARVVLELYELAPDSPVRATPLGGFDLPRLTNDGDVAEFFRVRDAIAQRTVRLVGSPWRIHGPEPGGSRQPEAWRLYVLAYQRLSDDFCGGSRPAIELLERALEVDPAFGLAWEALATARYNRFWACGEDAAILAEVLVADERALAVAPELRVPRLRRISMRIESGRTEEAYELLLDEATRYSDDTLTLAAQTYALRYAGFLELSAASLDRLLERDPLAYAVGAMGGSPATYLYQGHHERFLDVAPRSEMAYHRWYRGFAELLRERRDAARAALEPAFRSSPGSVFGGLSHALLAWLDGDEEAARTIVAAVGRQREQLGAADGEITYKQAQIFALAGAPGRALEELGRAVEQGFFCVACFERDPALDPLRGEPRWAEVVGAARARHLAFAAKFGLEPEPR